MRSVLIPLISAILTTALVLGVTRITGPSSAAPVPGETPEAGASAPSVQVIANGSRSEGQYVAIESCRIVDTRAAGGQVHAGQTRHFKARGNTGFEPQGGQAGGCGIPASASGVMVSVSATNIGGAGYFRTWPFGSSLPNATIAHYVAGPISTTGGTITLGAGSSDFSLRAFDSAASPVIDVTGYFIPPIAATVSGDGNLRYATPRVLGVTRIALGRYDVALDRVVTGCVAAVTMSAIEAAGAMVLSGSRGDVYTYTLVNGVLNKADLNWSFTVTC